MTILRAAAVAALVVSAFLPISAASGATWTALQAHGRSRIGVVISEPMAAHQAGPGYAYVFSPIEITLERNPDDFFNPFDVQAVGLVGGTAAPDGAHMRHIPGFYDGTAEDRALWRWRFMPDEPGAHDYAVRWEDGGGSDAEGSINVRRSHYRGPLASTGTRNHRWARDNRAFVPFFVAGPGPFEVDDPRFSDFLDFAQNTLGADGVASVLTNRVWADCADRLDCSPDSARLAVERWRQLDRYLAALHERGMLAYLMFYTDDAARPRFAGQSEMEQVLIRYAMARVGSFPNVIIDSGIDITEYRSRDWSEWFAESVTNADPYFHFVGSRHGGGSGEFECPRCLYDSRGEIHPTYADVRAVMDTAVKPVLYTDRWREDYRRGNFTADSLRAAMWSAAVGGGAGFMIGGAHGSLSLDDFESDLDNPVQFRTFADFWDSQPDLVRYGEPCEDAVSHGFCFGVPKREIAVYVPAGSEPRSVTVLAIEAHEFSEAWWLNPRTGEFTTAKPLGSPRTYTAPSADDWVLSVEWLGHGDPPAPTIFLPAVQSADRTASRRY